MRPYDEDIAEFIRRGFNQDPDILKAFIGEKLGEGVNRAVFRCKWDDERVFKIAVGSRPDFQNQAEWGLWNASGGTLGQWLAPVYYITPFGRLLKQAYCEPCPTHLIPKKVPKVLQADAHDNNWGIYEGRPVLRDYGRTYAYELANSAKAMGLVSREE